jgi:glucose-1-phosphate thymidylyltransferase
VKGIILAGGAGTRLHPITKVVSKQLLPVYDKPMVYYPLSTLMLARIKEILLISTPQDLPLYRRLLGDGHELGLDLQYAEQPRPGGLAQAFIVGRDFVGDADVALVLGDNIFHGEQLSATIQEAVRRNRGATIFGYRVRDPQRYGVAEFDAQGRVVGLEEKPAKPRSNHAVTGLYLYDNAVLDIAAGLKPSARGELEITDVNREYLRRGTLDFIRLSRGTAWLDTGTHQSLLEASAYIATLENRTGLKVACLEEIAWRMDAIGDDGLRRLAERHGGDMRDYLLNVLAEGS